MSLALSRIWSAYKPSARKTLRETITRRDALVKRALSYVPYLRTALLVAGYIYLLCLPSEAIGRGHYVSEHALQPAQVNTYWNWADVHIADKYADDVDRWQSFTSDERTGAIAETFTGLGLASARQSYTFTVHSNKTSAGQNVYGILHAPKTDGAEALVLAASWTSRWENGADRGRINTRGVALILALANYLTKYSMWSKDIIFLIADDYLTGTQAWLDAYHGYGQSNLQAERLSLSTGSIWAAVHLDYPHHSFSHAGIYYDGANGHLPNLDLVNSISHILKQTGIPVVLRDDLRSAELRMPFAAGLLSHLADSRLAQVYARAARNIVRQIGTAALGSPSGPEGLYGKYRIDALAIYAMPAEGPHGFYSLGRAVESTLRSLNNLLERLHQSFFLYLLTSVDSFISVGNYLAAPILISAAMTITGLLTWRRRSSAAETGSNQSQGATATALLIVGSTHALGVATFALIVYWIPQGSLPTFLRIPVVCLIPACIYFLPTYESRLMTTSARRALKSFNLIIAGLSIAVAATLNFGLAVALSLLFSPLLWIPVATSRTSRHSHSVSLLSAIVGLAGHRSTAVLIKRLLEDWQVVGVWTLPVLLTIVVPLYLQAVLLNLRI